jgi:hypothetical protein
MRILAYAILISGFVWICFGQLATYPIARAVTLAAYDKIPKQPNYKVEDVQKAIRDSVFDFARHVPSFYIGALLMLGGSLVLDFAGRRKRVQKPQPNTALEPTPTAH